MISAFCSVSRAMRSGRANPDSRSRIGASRPPPFRCAFGAPRRALTEQSHPHTLGARVQSRVQVSARAERVARRPIRSIHFVASAPGYEVRPALRFGMASTLTRRARPMRRASPLCFPRFRQRRVYHTPPHAAIANPTPTLHNTGPFHVPVVYFFCWAEHSNIPPAHLTHGARLSSGEDSALLGAAPHRLYSEMGNDQCEHFYAGGRRWGALSESSPCR